MWKYGLLVALALGACQFDRSGLGAQGRDDAAPGGADAAAVDSAPGAPDAPAATTADASVDAGDPNAGTVCGQAVCTGTDRCCITFDNGVGGGVQSADCKATCGDGEVTYACDGPEDCPGQDCCFTGQRGGSHCASGCGFGEVQACRASSDCTLQQCCPTQSPNVEICAAVCF
jgi:hypothetical protein